MSARLASEVTVKALIRRVHGAGGSAAVLARGDAIAGAILVLTVERGVNPRLFERGYGPAGQPCLVRTGPSSSSDPGAVADYLDRRRKSDPDLWVVEVDIAAAEQLAAEMLAGG